MAKPITGSKDHKQQVTILKASGNNISKIRCPNCRQMAHPIPDGKGGKIATCKSCNIKFSVQSL